MKGGLRGDFSVVYVEGIYYLQNSNVMDKHDSNAHGKYEKCLHRVLSDSMKEAGHIRNISVNEKIIFKW
jgi:hypothetical protein